MVDGPSQTNGTADSVDAVIHTAIMQVALSSAILAAEGAEPWLDTPVVKQVFEWMARIGFSYIDKFVEQAAAFAVMDAQTNAESAQYQAAVLALRKAPNDPKALANFKATLGKLIHYDGS